MNLFPEFYFIVVLSIGAIAMLYIHKSALLQRYKILDEDTYRFILTIKINAPDTIGNTDTHSYDPNVEGTYQDASESLSKLDGVSAVSSNATQPYSHAIKRRVVTFTYKMAIDCEKIDPAKIEKTIVEAVKNDSRHDGFQESDIHSPDVPDSDFRDELSELMESDHFKHFVSESVETEVELNE